MCHECGIEFCGLKGLKRHQIMIHNMKDDVPKPFVCEICGKQFSQKFSLKTHVLNHHTEKTSVDKCENCLTVFLNADEFNDHLKACLEDPKEFLSL